MMSMLQYEERPSIYMRIYKMPMSLLTCIIFCISPFLPFQAWFDAGFHNKQRIIEVVFLGFYPLLMLLKILYIRQINIEVQKGALCFLYLFFLLGFFSCLYAYSIRYAFFEWSSFILLITLAWAISKEINIKENSSLYFILIFCGIGCAFYLFNEILLYISVMLIGAQPSVMDLIFGFDNYRFLNHTQTVSLPLLGLLVLGAKRSSKQYWFWFVVASLWWTTLFVSAGRGTFIGVAAGGGMALFFRRTAAMPWCRMMLCTCLTGFIAYLFFYLVLPELRGLEPFGLAQNVMQRTLDSPTSGRLPLWRFAWGMILQHPWLGAGPLHFAHYGTVVGIAAHPHNWILQIASEWGIPALLCMAAAIAMAYRSLLHTAQYIQPDDLNAQAALSTWLATGTAILVDGLVSGLIVMPTSQLWIALYLGCAWGWTIEVSPKSGTQFSIRFKGRFLGIVAIMSALLLLWAGLYPEILDLNSREETAMKAGLYPNNLLLPRVWRAGFF
jgi:putative inorganic carbon (hco3(-)) transporter